MSRHSKKEAVILKYEHWGQGTLKTRIIYIVLTRTDNIFNVIIFFHKQAISEELNSTQDEFLIRPWPVAYAFNVVF